MSNVLNNTEFFLDNDEELVSTTDERGVITYANDAFIKISGYTKEELFGKNHNLVRHPDMPKAAFADLWGKLKAGKSWRGVVKNRTKDGGFYWVDAYVTPIYENGEMVGYQSVRVKPTDKMKCDAQTLYLKVNAGKRRVLFEVKAHHKGICALIISLLGSISSYVYGGPVVAFTTVTMLLLLGVILKDELLTTPQKIRSLKARTDSVSRLVYSGKGNHSIIDFNLGLAKAKNRTVLGRFLDLSNNLEAIGSKLNSAIQVAKEDSEQQKQELLQVATAMNEMSATANEIAQNTSETSLRVEQTSDKCSEALVLLEKSNSGIEELSSEIDQSSISAIALKDEAKSVGGLMGEIQGIAEQTNLLALNAAIEAARAGEHGRGFAVVADEVRSLSTRTQKSAEQIQKSITSMLNTIESWVVVMERDKEMVHLCNDSSTKSITIVKQINEMMQNISDLSAQIATAAEEQGSVAEDINRNVQSANDLADDSYNNATKLEDNAQSLSQSIEYIVNTGSTFSDKLS